MTKVVNVRKLFSALVVLALSAGFLSACGEDSVQNTKSGDEVALPSLVVTKNAKSAPKVEYDKDAKIKVEVVDEANSIGKSVTRVLDEGSGNEIFEGQNASISLVSYAMPGFKETDSTWVNGTDTPEVLSLVKNSSDPNDLASLLVGLKVGAVIGRATPGFKKDSSGLDMTGANYSLEVLIVDSAKDPVTRADGADVPKSQLDPKLPKVELADDGTPSITIPSGYTAPSESVSEALKIGTGPELTDTTTASFAYTAWRFDGTKFQSTWESKVPLTTPLSMVNPGWQKALTGAKVGSQYLVIVPKALSQNSTDTDLIYVIDVLDIVK